MKFSIKDLFSKCNQIHSFVRIWSHLLKKSLMENLISCAIMGEQGDPKEDCSVTLDATEIFYHVTFK